MIIIRWCSLRLSLAAAMLATLLMPTTAFCDIDLVPVFRMTSKADERLLTTSCMERRGISANGNWYNEGVMGFAPSTPQPDTVKVYRFALRSGSQHFYTTSRDEGLRAHFVEEPFNAYFYAHPQQGLVAVSRLSKGWEHFYTTNPAEAKSALNLGYKAEGLLGYVIDMQIDLCPTPTVITKPGFGGFDWSKAVADAAGSFKSFTGPAWEHIKTDTGPAINQGWLHFVGEVNGAFNLKCASDNPNCSIHGSTAQAFPANYNYDPQSLVRGNSPCKGPGETDYPAGTVTYFYSGNRAELVCNGYDNGSDPGYGSWTPTGRQR